MRKFNQGYQRCQPSKPEMRETEFVQFFSDKIFGIIPIFFEKIGLIRFLSEKNRIIPIFFGEKFGFPRFSRWNFQFSRFFPIKIRNFQIFSHKNSDFYRVFLDTVKNKWCNCEHCKNSQNQFFVHNLTKNLF